MRIKMIWSVLLVLPFVGLGSVAQAEILEYSVMSKEYYMQRLEERVYRAPDGRTMPYRLFLPADYDPKKSYPVVLSLHGAGARGDNNEKQIRPWTVGWVGEEVQREYPCILILPQCPAKEKWVDTPWNKGSYALEEIAMTRALTDAVAILDEVLATYATDADRVYLLGCSMGGYGTWDLVMRFPERFAAAVPICGAGDPSQIERIKTVPIWAFHGDQDRSVPLQGSLDMKEASDAVGGTAMRLTVYPGVEHDSFKIAWRDPQLLQWLFAQRLSNR